MKNILVNALIAITGAIAIGTILVMIALVSMGNTGISSIDNAVHAREAEKEARLRESAKAYATQASFHKKETSRSLTAKVSSPIHC